MGLTPLTVQEDVALGNAFLHIARVISASQDESEKTRLKDSLSVVHRILLENYELHRG